MLFLLNFNYYIIFTCCIFDEIFKNYLIFWMKTLNLRKL